jgi:hypothetical protein
MAYREVTMLEIKEVLRLFGSRVPKKRIAAQLGFHAKTVRRYVKVALESGWAPGQPLDDRLVETVVSRVQPVLGRPQGEGWARCEEHRALIQTFLDDDVRLSKIRTLLRRQQVLVSYATLRRFAISELGFGRTAPTIPILDCGPGEEVQLDTGWMTFLQGDLWVTSDVFEPGSSPPSAPASVSSGLASKKRRSVPSRRVSWRGPFIKASSRS